MPGKVLGLSAALLLGAWYQACAVNGFAVSSVQSPTPNCRSGTDARYFYGPIVKFAIQNDAVTRCDTIYKTRQASYPHLNIQGTKMAFIRRSIDQTGTDHSANDIYSYLSVMNLSDGSVTDIDSFFTWEFHNTNGSQLFYAIDWPAGDYIYYTKQVKWSYEGDGVPTTEVWKVKYNNPSLKTLVVKYWSVQTFGMSLDATRAGVTDLSSNEFHCLPHAFPPASNPTKAGWATQVWVGCGTYISPSGKYHQHFFGGGHEAWRINTWNPPNELLATVDISSNDFPSYSVDKSLTNLTIGGGPMEWARWAVNSDKWICGCTQLYGVMAPPFPMVGHNQVLCNWIDHKLIMTTRNHQAGATNCTKRENDPGDMWVAGGPCGAYEDVNGNWVATSVSCTGAHQLPARMPFDNTVSSQEVNVYTIHGRLVGTWDRTRISGTASRALPAGAYFLGPASPQRVRIAKIRVDL